MNINLGENTQKTIRGIVYVVIMLAAGFFIFKYFALKRETTSQITLLQNEIIQKDTTIKIYQGKYSKLVNDLNSANQLKTEAQKNYKLIYDTLTKRNEQILSITSANIKFISKTGTTDIKPTTKKDSFYFVSYYPNPTNYMARFTGNLNMETMKITENWDFQKFKLGLILTQRKDGLWDYYVDAPEYAEVSNVTVNSLPPTAYNPVTNKLFGLWGGLGLRTSINNFGSINNKNLVFKGGLSIKNNTIFMGDVSTDKTVGIGFLVKF